MCCHEGSFEVMKSAGAPGVNVQGNVVNCPAEDVEIGQRVRAVFEEATDPATGQALLIPQWEPLSE